MFEKGAESDVKALHRRSPRMLGLYLFLIGAGFLAVNVALMQFSQRFVDKLFFVGFALGLVGCWILITGRASPKETPAPFWWNAIAVLLTFVGILLGLLLSEHFKNLYQPIFIF